jgi:lipoprotein-anchoring transpeptidase ErfK/SrfK
MRQLFLLLMLFVSLQVNGQGYVDQDKVEPLLNSQSGPVTNVEKVQWQVYDYTAFKKGDKNGPWTTLQAYINAQPGSNTYRLEVVELANRVTSDRLKAGRKLVIPATFPGDYRAYSPYPFEYAVASNLPKLFIIDKFTQTFGAYEHGKLVRWGLVSTGSTNDKTPAGKYNFNWKAEYRESSAAPAGEVWKMHYMFNFEPRYGLHVHQYSLPISSPASHGCVRLTMADAIWNFNWAEGWGDNGKKKGTPVWIINRNPGGRAAHWEINADGQVSSLVKLPNDDGNTDLVNR